MTDILYLPLNILAEKNLTTIFTTPAEVTHPSGLMLHPVCRKNHSDTCIV